MPPDVPFARATTEVDGQPRTVLTRDGRVWAMIEGDRPDPEEIRAAERRALERWTGHR